MSAAKGRRTDGQSGWVNTTGRRKGKNREIKGCTVLLETEAREGGYEIKIKTKQESLKQIEPLHFLETRR